MHVAQGSNPLPGAQHVRLWACGQVGVRACLPAFSLSHSLIHTLSLALTLSLYVSASACVCGRAFSLCVCQPESQRFIGAQSSFASLRVIGRISIKRRERIEGTIVGKVGETWVTCVRVVCITSVVAVRVRRNKGSKLSSSTRRAVNFRGLGPKLPAFHRSKTTPDTHMTQVVVAGREYRCLL